MDIALKSFVSAVLAAFLLVGVAQAFIKTNDVRNYPGLKALAGRNNNQPGLADVDPNSKAANANPYAANDGRMTKGEEEAAKRGGTTELENPNK
jgi:hypothetical protein